MRLIFFIVKIVLDKGIAKKNWGENQPILLFIESNFLTPKAMGGGGIQPPPLWFFLSAA